LKKISRRDTIIFALLLTLAIACLVIAISGLRIQTLDLGFRRQNDGTLEATATGISEVILASCIGIGAIIWFAMKSRR